MRIWFVWWQGYLNDPDHKEQELDGIFFSREKAVKTIERHGWILFPDEDIDDVWFHESDLEKVQKNPWADVQVMFITYRDTTDDLACPHCGGTIDQYIRKEH